MKKRKQNDIEYREYLEQISSLAEKVINTVDNTVVGIDTTGKRALYDFFDENKELALKVFEAIKNNAPNGFRGNPMKRRVVKKALSDASGLTGEQLEKLMELVVQNEEF